MWCSAKLYRHGDLGETLTWVTAGRRKLNARRRLQQEAMRMIPELKGRNLDYGPCLDALRKDSTTLSLPLRLAPSVQARLHHFEGGRWQDLTLTGQFRSKSLRFSCLVRSGRFEEVA
jgi:hypothetical protein